MKEALIVFAGGGFGSLCRWLLSLIPLPEFITMPLGTWMANALACMLAGFFSAWALQRTEMRPEWKLLILTGFCGGFSTLSSLLNESFWMQQQSRPLGALLNVFGTLLLCSASLITGVYLSRLISANG